MFNHARAERAQALGRHIDLISDVTCQIFSGSDQKSILHISKTKRID